MPVYFWAIGITFLILGIIILIYAYRKYKAGGYSKTTVSEDILEDFIRKYEIDEVVFAYSDVSHEEVMHKASRALAAGANYRLISGKFTQIKS
ncbi:unnamed protein product, partial [marine sediment metagenome]